MTDSKGFSVNTTKSAHDTLHSILVIGDAMLDKYWFSRPKNLANEAPVINIKVNKCEYRAGGAANVALNIKSLSEANSIVSIYAPLGLDESGNILSQLLLDKDIKCFWQYESNKTITKHRILTNKHQLLRVDFEEDYQELELNSNLKKIIDCHDVIVISDYQKGAFSKQELSKIIGYARNYNKKILIDPKAKDFSIYKGATLITPNSKEFAAAVASVQHMDEQAKELMNKLEFEYLLITQGADGMTLYSKDGDSYHASSYADEVYDVTGAGDTVIASMAVSLAKGESMKNAVEYASYAAALVVSQVATVSVARTDVDHFMQRAQNPKQNLTDKDKILCVSTDFEYQDAVTSLLGHDIDNSYSIYYWDYQQNNILTKNNVSDLIKQKKSHKLCVVITASFEISKDLQLNHSIDELVYMLSNLSVIDKIIYSKQIELGYICKQKQLYNYIE